MSVAIALTIAGSDSSGGAGVQADLKTFSALGVYGASVITAVTSQNTKGVAAVHNLPVAVVTTQIDAVLSDLRVGAVKIGMLSCAEVIEAVASALARWNITNVVLDPVLVASTGARLLEPQALDVLRRVLLPRALVLTPNLPEAAALLDGVPAANESEMRAQAERLLALGTKAVLIKGGHGKGPESADFLVDAKETVRFATDRIETKNTHGTGCTLSSAIAAGLAKGHDLRQAVRAAKDYVTAAIAAADRLQIGSGSGPVHHFHRWW
jgi:hydroxymethylpyrimidine/phosphomethylpyrimidine kinase